MSDVDTFAGTPAPHGPGLELDVAGRLSIALQTIAGSLDRHSRAARRLEDLVMQAGLLLPTSAKVQNVVTVDGSGNGVLDLGGPAQGRVWDLRALVVGRLQVTTTAAGTAYVFATAAGAQQIPVAVGLADLADVASTLPLNSFYGAGDVVLRYPEKLYVWISAGDASVQYVAAARVLDRLETPTTRASVDV